MVNIKRFSCIHLWDRKSLLLSWKFCPLVVLFLFASAVTFSLGQWCQQSHSLCRWFTGDPSWLSEHKRTVQRTMQSGRRAKLRKVGKENIAEQGILPLFILLCTLLTHQSFISRVGGGGRCCTQWLNCAESGSCDGLYDHSALEAVRRGAFSVFLRGGGVAGHVTCVT